MSQLDRFIKAQENDYQIALDEIKNGSKDSCWMWYIFPQIKGLGLTEMSKTYAIKNIEEAIEYLNNEILRTRLIEITQALLDLGAVDIKKVMGFPDNLKLKSSMTLFREAEKESKIKCDNIFQKVLDQFFEGEEDPKTLVILQKQQYEKEKGLEKKEEDEEDNEKSTVHDIIEDYNKNKNIVLNEHMTDRNIKDQDKENIDTNAQEETNLENENEIKTPFSNKNNNDTDNIQEKKEKDTITSNILDANNDNLENNNINNRSLDDDIDDSNCCSKCLII